MLNEDDVLESGDEPLMPMAPAAPPAKPPGLAPRRAPRTTVRRKNVVAKATPARTARTAAKKRATKSAVPPPGLARVRAGNYDVWLERELAKALSQKDRKKLKAVLKRAAKRSKKSA